MSTEDTSSQFEDIRNKFGRFRILIVGRANAGKTSILQKICNTTESPEIYDGKGNKIDPSQVEGSMGRGIHDIENELIFRSNDKFIFHDSQGFEAGRKDEFVRMKKFIADRANTTQLKKRLHAIWYCIPMDKIDRAIQRSEEMFFEECDPNNVPVVVLFTKFDALRVKAMVKLAPADRRLALQEGLSKIQPLMEEVFNGADVWGRLSKMTYPPKSSVRLENIHKANEGCNILIENTALVLNDEALQMLFVSAQETNMALCVKYAAKRLISDVNGMYKTMLPTGEELQIYKLACWFPHFQRVSCNG
ncbi:hypothetical protein EV363DRAFT_1583172 [Boletus edulis]|nr:hypothetical protein EV363DRAFT_1583172 [Boletus edulis]